MRTRFSAYPFRRTHADDLTGSRTTDAHPAEQFDDHAALEEVNTAADDPSGPIVQRIDNRKTYW